MPVRAWGPFPQPPPFRILVLNAPLSGNCRATQPRLDGQGHLRADSRHVFHVAPLSEEVKAHNTRMRAGLTGNEREYKAEEENPTEPHLQAVRLPQVLLVKEGELVRLLWNANMAAGAVNGRLAVVESLADDHIMVRFNDGTQFVCHWKPPSCTGVYHCHAPHHILLAACVL